MICYSIDLLSLSFSGWRKSLSDLEVTVEVLFGKQCELVGGTQRSEEFTPDVNTRSRETCGRSLCLAGGHTLLCGPTTNTLGLPSPLSQPVSVL